MRGGVSVCGQSPKPLTPTLSPLKRGVGVSGRGFNVFKLLRQILRAIVTAKPG